MPHPIPTRLSLPLPLAGVMVAALLFAALPAAAQQAQAPAREDWEAKRAKITELRTQARQMRAEAAQQFATAEKLCLQKFLAADCLADARKAKVGREQQAGAIEREAQALDREIKAEQRATRMARNEEKARQNTADAGQRAEQMRRKADQNARRQEEKAAKAQPCPCDCPR